MKAFDRGAYSMALFITIALIFVVVIFGVPLILYSLLNCIHSFIPAIEKLSFTTVMGLWCLFIFTYTLFIKSRKED